MAFFLVDRDRSDSSIRLLSPVPFSSREEALSALPGLIVAGDSQARDVFVCDLDAATPVLFVAQPAASLAEVSADTTKDATATDEIELPDEPAAGVWEAPASDSEESEPSVADAVIEDDTEGLAGALRRAADSLESQGIVAPDSIAAAVAIMPDVSPSEADPVAGTEDASASLDTAVPTEETGAVEADADDMVEGDAAFSDELASAIASLGVELPEPERETVSEPVASEWPWANVEQVDVDSTGVVEEMAEVEPQEESTMESMSASDDVDSLLLESESTDFVPKPVIMGDYGNVPEGLDEEDTDSLQPVVEDAGLPEAADQQVPPLPDEETPSLAAELAAVDTAPTAYEPGEIQLDEYGCDDCVYANTCPKAGTSSPSECGSFQWKSV